MRKEIKGLVRKEILSVERKRVPWKDVDFVGDLTAIHRELQALPNVAGWVRKAQGTMGPESASELTLEILLENKYVLLFSCFQLQIV
jgi:hypothetical protein